MANTNTLTYARNRNVIMTANKTPRIRPTVDLMAVAPASRHWNRSKRDSLSLTMFWNSASTSCPS